MTTLRAWVHDRLVPADQATISVYDQGFRTGEGVFETLRAYGAHVFRLDAHLDRAVTGADALGFDPGPREQLVEAVTRTAAANLEALQGRDSALRLTVSSGAVDPDSPFPGTTTGPPTVVVTSHRLTDDTAAWRDGWRAVTVSLVRELPHVKALSYALALTAKRQARAAGAQEALLVTEAGQVLEGSGSNLFAVLDGRVVTPPLESGLLAGVTRAVVLEVAAQLELDVAQRPLTLEELHRADEAFLTATTREVVPLVAVDDRPVGPGVPGPTTFRIHAGYRAAVEAERSSGA